MTSEERLDFMRKLMASSDGELLLHELMTSYVLDEDMGVIEERAAIDHPVRAYYEAGQRSVVLKLRAIATMEERSDGE